jgi:DNA-binding NarL/FixJ family response regulator
VRIVIGEDSTLFREGLARLLVDAGHDVVARCADAPTVLDAITELEPDLAIIDVRMPPDLTDDGARVARAVRVRHPTIGIVLLSQHVETRHSLQLVTQGGFGYLLKDRVLDLDEFLDAIGRVATGGSALDPEVVARLLAGGHPDDALATLTPREHDVLGLMAEGRTNTGIGHRLWLTERTVEGHVASILSKLHLTASPDDHRRVQAVLVYLAHQAAWT